MGNVSSEIIDLLQMDTKPENVVNVKSITPLY